jgi:hypothetical protein
MGRTIDTVYTKVDGTDYSKLNIISPNYNYTTVVDTKYVKYLELFNWNKLNTDDGIYFSTRVTDISHRLCIKPLNLQLEKGKQILLHRLIAFIANLPHPEGHDTVDHIDRETLDNREANLRWASQMQQNQNTDKRTRKANARPLPDDIQGPLPKYVTWNVSTETTKAGKVLERKFFRIEKHPAQKGKTWTTTKKASVNNEDKLNEARAKLVELDALLEPEDGSRDTLFQEYQKIISVN